MTSKTFFQGVHKYVLKNANIHKKKEKEKPTQTSKNNQQKIFETTKNPKQNLNLLPPYFQKILSLLR